VDGVRVERSLPHVNEPLLAGLAACRSFALVRAAIGVDVASVTRKFTDGAGAGFVFAAGQVGAVDVAVAVVVDTVVAKVCFRARWAAAIGSAGALVLAWIADVVATERRGTAVDFAAEAVLDTLAS
jgi:hypothetical protein